MIFRKLLIGLTLLTIQVRAQVDSATLRNRYEKEVIYFGGSGYLKNDIRYPRKNLKNEFKLSPTGKEMFDLSRSDMKKTIICFSFFVASYSAGLVALKNDQKGTATGLFLASAIPYGISYHFILRGGKRFKKAIWLRNRDVLLN